MVLLPVMSGKSQSLVLDGELSKFYKSSPFSPRNAVGSNEEQLMSSMPHRITVPTTLKADPDISSVPKH